MSDIDDDDEPFAIGSSLASGLAGMAGGEHARLGVEADNRRRFRLNIEHWAKKHGLPIDDGKIVVTVDDAQVSVALYEMTDETAVVRSTAPAPAGISLAVEPLTQSWTSSLFGRFKKKSAATGDADFDAKFHIKTSDDAAMRQILEDEARLGLLAMNAYCTVSYVEGRIELRLDSPRLAGGHIRRAIAVVAAMARARVQTSAYR